jgi:hypothetical protein
MQLRPEHYLEIICEAAGLSEDDATKIFIHKYNMHVYRNKNFIQELDQWIRNLYHMYKQYLYRIQKVEPKNRRIDQMYTDKISIADMLDERFKLQNIDHVYYNKLVWAKINNAYRFFIQTVNK